MAATTYGSLGKYGLSTEAAKGLYAGSMSVSVNVDTATVPNHEGEIIGASFFNENAEISLSGVTVNAATTSQTIKSALDIANTDAYGTDTSVTNFYVNGLTISRTNNDFETGDVSAIGWAGV